MSENKKETFDRQEFLEEKLQERKKAGDKADEFLTSNGITPERERQMAEFIMDTMIGVIDEAKQTHKLTLQPAFEKTVAFAQTPAEGVILGRLFAENAIMVRERLFPKNPLQNLLESLDK